MSKELEMILVKHTCSRTWNVARNSLTDKILYCPYCKSDKGFKEVKKKINSQSNENQNNEEKFMKTHTKMIDNYVKNRVEGKKE